MLDLILIRHGHTVWHDTGHVAGRTDVDLSDVGITAVNDLAKSWPVSQQPDSWHCSPLLRTRHTARLLRQGHTSSCTMPEVELDKRLVELDFGRWEGMTWQSVHENYTDEMAQWGEDWINHAPPDGEKFKQQLARCEQWLGDLLASDHLELRNHKALVVTHGGSIRALVCHCLGWPLTRAMDFRVDPASVNHLELDSTSGQWRLRALNGLNFG